MLFEAGTNSRHQASQMVSIGDFSQPVRQDHYKRDNSQFMGSDMSHSPKFKISKKNQAAAFTHAANFELSNEANSGLTLSKVDEIHRNRVIMSKSPNIFAQI